LEAAGFRLGALSDEKLPSDAVLIAGPGCAQELAGRGAAVRDWVRAGGRLAAIGLGPEDADALLPGAVRMKTAEHIAAYFDPPADGSWRAGIGPADVQNRDPRNLPLVARGAAVVGDGVLAKVENENVVFSQLAPWEFDPAKGMNL